MKRVLALLALTMALAGCQSMKRELFGPPKTTTTTVVTTAPASPPTTQPYGQPPYGQAYGQPYGQPTYGQPYGQPTYAAPTPTPPPTTTLGPVNLTQAPTDAGQRALLDADRQLGAAAQERGLGQAIAAIADTDVTMITPAGTLVGASQIGANAALQATAGSLFWQPERATLSGSQDFGQTIGRYVQVMRGTEAVQGRYITVWRKDSSGRWRIVSNTFMADPVARKATTSAATARRR